MPVYLTGTTDPAHYSDYLEHKCSYILDLFKAHNLSFPKPEIFPSSPVNYRMRAEFALFFRTDVPDPYFEYVMFQKQDKGKKRIFLNDFTPGAKPIGDLFCPLRRVILQDENLTKGLFQIDFLVNLAQECVITLHYHKKLIEISFNHALNLLQNALGDLGFKIKGITARARGQQLISGDPFIIETFHLKDGSTISLKQLEGTFSQPNAAVCCKMLDFARDCSFGQYDNSLLELYCGSGTFTVALAPLYKNVLATEICRTPAKTALENLERNGITNTKIARLSAAEAGDAVNRTRNFKRLELAKINLDDYSFKTIFIDPPRSGVGSPEGLAFTAQFDRIIYISCGMESLAEDLKFLTKTHKIESFALFDQFPYTLHLESGVLLTKKHQL